MFKLWVSQNFERFVKVSSAPSGYITNQSLDLEFLIASLCSSEISFPECVSDNLFLNDSGFGKKQN